jgi:hypothetical protein
MASLLVEIASAQLQALAMPDVYYASIYGAVATLRRPMRDLEVVQGLREARATVPEIDDMAFRWLLDLERRAAALRAVLA